MLTQNKRLVWKGQAWTMLSLCLSKRTQRIFQKQLKKKIKETICTKADIISWQFILEPQGYLGILLAALQKWCCSER